MFKRKPPKTGKEILKLAKKEEIEIIELQFSDLTGRPKKLEVEAIQLEYVLKDGLWYDGSSIEGHGRIAESDMRLIPDFSTFVILPNCPDCKTARFICDVFTPDGKPFEGDPRYILKKIISLARRNGLAYFVGPELEFFLFDRSKLPEITPHDRRGYFDDSGRGRSSDLLRKVMRSLPAFDIQGECQHHEVAPGQHEIDIKYDEVLKMADSVMTIKRLLKAYDDEFGLKVTFMPKPISGINGSGMHVHQSLFSIKNDVVEKNIFFSSRDRFKLSEIALNFIAGQLKYAKAMCALVASSVNSYKRLVPGYEAPVNICWGQTNRSALIRVPRVTEKRHSSTRLELRCPDPYCNPYLAFAAMLACGLDGILNKLEPPEPVNENVYEINSEQKQELQIDILPKNLEEAICELQKCEPLLDLLGEETMKKFVSVCQKDIETARLEVTPWEIDRYL